jgi:hypothetical protein
MKRPLVAVVSCYTVGLLLGGFFQRPLAGLFAASFVLLVLVLACLAVAFTRRRVLALEKLCPFLIWPLLALTGWANLASRTAVLSPNDLRAQPGDQPALATVRGTLVATPQLRVFERDAEESWRTLAQMQVTRRLRGTQWLPADGQIIVTTPGTLSGAFFGGQTVEISGVLAPPDAPAAEGLFDYRAYLRRQGIYYQLKAGSTNDWVLRSASPAPPLPDRFIAWATKTMSRGLPDDQATQLMLAMTLGQKTALTDEVNEPFMRSGTILSDWYQIMGC